MIVAKCTNGVVSLLVGDNEDYIRSIIHDFLHVNLVKKLTKRVDCFCAAVNGSGHGNASADIYPW